MIKFSKYNSNKKYEFDYEEFSKYVSELLNSTSKEEVNSLSDEEYDQLLNLILGSNKNVDDYLRSMGDEEWQKYLMQNMKD